MIRKRTEELVNLDFESGETVLIDKGLNKSSFYVIYKFQKSIGVKKAGHAGTLDPKATGLLIVCTGKNTKKISEFQGLSKTYEGVIEIGKKTPSMDTETEVSEEKDISGITEEDIYHNIVVLAVFLYQLQFYFFRESHCNLTSVFIIRY
ncbi:MAG TPA: hypothetical protein VHP30_13915, partial [Ignavibacteriales bacterium]|nr:hypothetical protein [Ignavibacteriales bacterium]